MANTSAATRMPNGPCLKSPTRPQVISALAPTRASAATASAAPQKRQRRDDHSRPQYAKHRQDVFDDVRHLHADDGIDRQAHAAQPPGDRRHHAVGLGIGQAPRCAVGEVFPVRRVGERWRIGSPLGEAAEHLVDADADLAAWRLRRSLSGIAEDHCSARFG
jgi:hypothetical protein